MKKQAFTPYLPSYEYVPEDNPDQYIANITDGTVIGYKYFDFQNLCSISVKVKGTAGGDLLVSCSPDGEPIEAIHLTPAREYTEYSTQVSIEDGVSPLFFRYKGTGKFDFMAFTLR